MGGGCLDEGPHQDQPISQGNGGIVFVGLDLRDSDGLVSIYECCAVSRQLQAVDCDEDGGIVMREIAVGLCAAGGCCPYYLGIPT
jgi:hypothetical protein